MREGEDPIGGWGHGALMPTGAHIWLFYLLPLSFHNPFFTWRTFLALKPALSDLSGTTPAFLDSCQQDTAFRIPFPLSIGAFMYKASCFLQHVLGSGFFLHPGSLCLLVAVSKPLTFKVMLIQLERSSTFVTVSHSLFSALHFFFGHLLFFFTFNRPLS